MEKELILMMVNATFNKSLAISLRSVLLVEQTLVHRKPLTCHNSLTNFIT